MKLIFSLSCATTATRERQQKYDKLTIGLSVKSPDLKVIVIAHKKAKRKTQPNLMGSTGSNLVRMTGLEPARSYHKILSLARLPIPPHPQSFISLTH